MGRAALKNVANAPSVAAVSACMWFAAVSVASSFETCYRMPPRNYQIARVSCDVFVGSTVSTRVQRVVWWVAARIESVDAAHAHR